MKSALAVLALAASSTHATVLTADYVEANHNTLFASFKHAHGRNYTTAGDEAARKQVFKTNMLKAAESQARNPRATFGATRFSDMTEEELYPFTHGVPQMATAQADAPSLFTDEEVAAALATGVDWRSKGAVAAVQDQGDCGSCWAFSIIGASEGANFLHGSGKLVKLSEQEPLVCIVGMGCDGGFPRDAIEYIESNSNQDGQLATEATYPYLGTGHHQKCQIGVNASVEIGATIKGYAKIPKDEDQIAAYMVKNGPVSVVISAVDWTSYTGGVMDNCDGGMLDHAVLAVGVTEDYWVIKNSWGAQWGESGYIRLAYGKNTCMINNMPNCPTM